MLGLKVWGLGVRKRERVFPRPFRAEAGFDLLPLERGVWGERFRQLQILQLSTEPEAVPTEHRSLPTVNLTVPTVTVTPPTVNLTPEYVI